MNVGSVPRLSCPMKLRQRYGLGLGWMGSFEWPQLRPMLQRLENGAARARISEEKLLRQRKVGFVPQSHNSPQFAIQNDFGPCFPALNTLRPPWGPFSCRENGTEFFKNSVAHRGRSASLNVSRSRPRSCPRQTGSPRRAAALVATTATGGHRNSRPTSRPPSSPALPARPRPRSARKPPAPAR